MQKHSYAPSFRLNPLDSVEDLLIANDWVYNRLTNEELILDINGRSCDYTLCFTWNENSSLLKISCEIDEEIPEGKMGEAILVANELSQSMDIGFFFVNHDTKKLVHKYSLLAGEDESDKSIIDRGYLASVVESILKDCEENFTVIKYFLNKDVCKSDKKLVSLLIMPAEGNA